MAVSNGAAGDTSGQPFAGLISVAGIAEQGFAAYEGAQVAKSAVSKFSSQDLLYVALGLGALGVLALFVFKH